MVKAGLLTPIDEGLAQREKETVIQIIREGKTLQKALEVAVNALILADHLMGLLESQNPLPRPMACKSGCHCCCFNQVEVTPSEALIIGNYVEHGFTADEKAGLMQDLDRIIQVKAGKNPKELAHLRQELPCPLLRGDICAVYRVRPLVCRAMHSLDAQQCELEFRSNSLMGVEHYSHRHLIVASIAHGLMQGCREMGCQSRPLELARALQDFFLTPRPIETWIQGEQAFRSSPPP